jgi:putative colanic acid biosynthesis glycosyltransferase
MMADTPATPLVSVISITLNDRDGLVRTIESLQAQISVPDYEHIVVDGMSDYHVSDLLADLGSPARLYRGRDAGLYDAMNRGTELARGQYLLYLNSGDTLAAQDVLSTIGAVLTEKRPDFLWGDSLERQLDGKIRHKPSRPIKRLPFGMISHHQAMLFSRAVIETNAIRFNLSYRIAADYDFVLHHVRASLVTLYLPEPICIFDRGGSSYQKRDEARREQFRIRRDFFLCSTTFAIAVFVAQWLLRSFRGMFPRGYWALRKYLG